MTKKEWIPYVLACALLLLGRYKMVYKKVWNHFCYPLGDDCKCRNLF